MSKSTGKEIHWCKYCGNGIEAWPSDDRKFCDKECHGDRLSENDCDYCGKSIEITEADKEYWDSHFCDRGLGKTVLTGREEKDTRFGDNWQKMRSNVLGCSTGLIDVHHIVPRREFEELENENRMNNLVTLCRSDHMKMEAKSEDEQRSILGVAE